MPSNLSAFDFIQEKSEATPGLWNRAYSALSANIAANDLSSGGTLSISSNLSIGEDLWVKGSVLIGAQPSTITRAALRIAASSAVSDYILFEDSSAARSDYLLGSRVGGTADGLNLWDESGATMIVSFSKQSVRFYQNVVGPVFDLGGALAKTYNAATFGTGADSTESRIQSAINQASIDAFERVYLPASMLSYGASSVSFIQSILMVREGGAWNIYDPTAYGAKGDGVADDTAAIQRMFNVIPQNRGLGTVEFSGGTFVVSGLTLQHNQLLLRGGGLGRTIIYLKASANTTILQILGGAVTNLQGIHIRDIMFDGNRSNQSSGVAAHGVQISSVWNSTFGPGLRINSCVSNGFHLTTDGGSGNVQNWFTGVFVENCGNVGLYANTNHQQQNILNSIFQWNNRAGVEFDGGTGTGTAIGGYIQGNYFESASSSSGIQPTGIIVRENNQATGLAIVGNLFNQSFQTGIWLRGTTQNVLVTSNRFGNMTSDISVDDPGSFGHLFLWNSWDTARQSLASSFFVDMLGNEFSILSNVSIGGNLLMPATSRVVLGTYALRSTAGTPNAVEVVDFPITDYRPFRASALYAANTGSAILPAYSLSEVSLGWYRSGASTMALSYGTLLVNGPMWSSGISVGGGTLIPQISSMSSLVGAFIIQGSSSSFTGIAWTAAGIGDIVLCAPFQSGAASSVSSGLVPHSLVTVAGQIEFRLSNVSTLVQNQSAQTWVFTRIRPF